MKLERRVHPLCNVRSGCSKKGSWLYTIHFVRTISIDFQAYWRVCVLHDIICFPLREKIPPPPKKKKKKKKTYHM